MNKNISTGPEPKRSNAFNSDNQNILPVKNDFTFERQRKFKFIEQIECLVNREMPYFVKIWPLLGAYTNENNAWRLDLCKELELIGISHYTFLKSLCYIYRNKDFIDINDPDQRFKNVVFHVSILNEVVVQLHGYISKSKKNLGILPQSTTYEVLSHLIKHKDALNNDNLTAEKRLSINEKYESAVAKLKELHGDQYKYIDDFVEFRQKAQPVRNIFTHYPTIDIFYRIENRKREKLMVKPEYIKRHKTIRSINSLKRSDLTDPFKYISEVFSNSLKVFNNLWEIFYYDLEIINNHPQFKSKLFTT